MNRSEIEAELVAWMESGDWTPDPDRFERVARALFDFQFGHSEPYALLCRSLDRTPDRIACADEIPAVPTGAFKEFDLRCFPAESTIRTFRTSGTSMDRRGKLHLDDLSLYEASLLASLRHSLLVRLTDRPLRMRFLAPSPEEAPDSSLSYMFGALLAAEGDQKSGFDLEAGQIDLEGFRRAITDAQIDRSPTIVAGTAFAFVHLLDEVEGSSSTWRLPAGSRVMETGGFKGRSREVSRERLHHDLATLFGVEATHVANQYGMTELGSQFYDSTIAEPDRPRRKRVPPWTRVRLVDPLSGADVAPGEVGMILIHDLANVGSVAAIQTADLGRAVVDETGVPIGFEVLGRATGAEARGCSIATDIMLEASGGARR